MSLTRRSGQYCMCVLMDWYPLWMWMTFLNYMRLLIRATSSTNTIITVSESPPPSTALRTMLKGYAFHPSRSLSLSFVWLAVQVLDLPPSSLFLYLLNDSYLGDICKAVSYPSYANHT